MGSLRGIGLGVFAAGFLASSPGFAAVPLVWPNSLVPVRTKGILQFPHSLLHLASNNSTSANCSSSSASVPVWTGLAEGSCPIPLRPVPWATLARDEAVAAALKEVRAVVEEAVAQLAGVNITVALHAGVVVGGQEVLAVGKGSVDASAQPPLPPSSDTVFNLGSVTKIFTSLLARHHAEMGHLSMDDTIGSYFSKDKPPVWNVRNPYSSDAPWSPQLASLAAQTSGLPREPPCGVFPPASCTEEITFSALSSYYSALFPEFSTPHYSNLGFALLGRAVERAVSATFERRASEAANAEEQQVEEKEEEEEGRVETYEELMVGLLRSLGLNQTGFAYTPSIVKHMATGYAVSQNGSSFSQSVSPYNTQQMEWAAPCGGMYSTPRDLSLFLALLLNCSASLPLYGPLSSTMAGKGQEAATLAASGGGTLATPTVADYLSYGGFTNAGGASGFSKYGFETYLSCGFRVLTKGGLVPGFASSIVLIPSLQLGVHVLLNINSGSSADSVAAAIANTLAPALNASLTANQLAPALPPANYASSIVGDYGVNGQVLVSVAWADSTKAQLVGTVIGYEGVEFAFDAQQSILDGSVAATIALRFRVLPGGRFSSCMLREQLADDGVILFVVPPAHDIGPRPPGPAAAAPPVVLIAPDLRLFEVPKM